MSDMNRSTKERAAVRLSKRLKLVASFVPENARIADIGTDHGFVPIYLAETGRIRSALAMDVREGPLGRAKEHVEEYYRACRGRGSGEEPCSPVHIETRLSDGLKKLSPGEADTVIIAGMGGELMIRILEEGCHMWDSVESWILSPQSALDKVRIFLAQNGFSIADEAMIKEDGKFYTVMRVSRGNMEYANQAQYLYGKILIEKRDAVLGEYLEREKKRLDNILVSFEGKQGQATGSQEKAIKALTEELSWVKEAQHEMQ